MFFAKRASAFVFGVKRTTQKTPLFSALQTDGQTDKDLLIVLVMKRKAVREIDTNSCIWPL